MVPLKPKTANKQNDEKQLWYYVDLNKKESVNNQGLC